MNRGLAGLLLLLLPLGLAAEPSPPSVYVDSVPLGARITLDGQLTESRTPTLLRGLSEGKHTVSLWKSGFLPLTQGFAVTPGKVPRVAGDLEPESVVLAFPANDQIVSGEGNLATEGRQFRFPAANYFLSGSDEAPRMTPVFEDTALLDTSGWALSLSGAGVLAFATGDVLAGHAAQPTFLTISLAAAAAGELAWQLSLQTRRAKFYRETAPTASPQPERLNLAATLFREGEQALQGGDLSAAEGLFRQLLRAHPDSKWVPGTWFRLAKIHSVTGRRDLALGEYRLVATTFPQPEFHNRARQALADLAEAAGDPQEALVQLDQMVLTDGSSDLKSIEAQRDRLTKTLATPPPAPAEPTTDVDTGPRRGYDRFLSLFAQGHGFIAEELGKIGTIQDALTERGDADLAADLDLVRLAVGAASAAAETGDGEAAMLALVAQRDQQNWRSLRDAGLTLFRVSSAVAMGAAVVYDRDSSQPVFWTMAAALGTMGLSLFPMLWAEPRQ